MIKRVLVIVITLTIAFFYSCGPQKIADEASSRCQPEDLRVDVNSGTMDISWTSKCDQLISGYNIYINEVPLVAKYAGSSLPESVEPFNSEPYAGDTDPDDGVEHFIAERLENGKRYYVSVRVVNPDLTVSKPSNEVIAICGPSGEIELSVRYKSDQDGYSFDRNEYVRVDGVENDIYFFSDGKKDFLNSPSKLSGFLKENRLAPLKLKGTFDDVRAKISQVTSEPGEQKVSVKKGDWLHLRTPEGANAVIKVMDISGSGEDRQIRLFFAFNSLPGEMLF